MSQNAKATRLRVELEIVPVGESERVQTAIRAHFDTLLKTLVSENLINIREHGASMTCVDVTPFEWLL